LIDPPGSIDTRATAINATGASADYSTLDKNTVAGFVFSNAAYITVRFWKDRTCITNIDDSGNVSGLVYANKSVVLGLTDFGGKMTTYTYPGASISTVTRALFQQENLGTYSQDDVLTFRRHGGITS
jgi:hypothetical protein